MRGVAVLGWCATALVATAMLGVVGAKAGPFPEWGHLLGHIVLCGGTSLGAAAALQGSVRRRALGGLLAGVGLGLAIEVVQARFHPVWSEATYDLAIDALGAWVGLLLWGRGRPAVSHLASAVLHPLVVGPVGIAAVVGPRWTVLLALCLLPALAAWVSGVRDGRLSDADVSLREERGPLFLVGTCSGVAFLLLASLGGAAVQSLGWLLTLGAVLGTSVTAAGFKVSGHVGIPVVLGLWAWAHDARAAVPLLGAALLMSWARPAAGRHRPVEVGGAWALGAVVGLSWMVLGS